MSFRVSIAQQPLAWQDAAANRAHFESVLAPLAGATDLVILPEMFTTGFTMRPEQFAEAPDGDTRAWLLQQARALDAAVGGSVAVNDEGRYYNRFMLALPGGPTYWYDKRRPYRAFRFRVADVRPPHALAGCSPAELSDFIESSGLRRGGGLPKAVLRRQIAERERRLRELMTPTIVVPAAATPLAEAGVSSRRSRVG